MILFNYLSFISLIIIEIFSSDLWTLFIYGMILLGASIFLASRAGDKILKGLQGTAATTIIARGVYDAYNKWKDNKPSNNNDNNSGNNNSNTDKTPNKNQDINKTLMVIKPNEK